MKKNILVLASVVTIAAAGIGGTSLAHAATTTSGKSAASSSAKHQKSHDKQIRLDARLNQAVRDGVITESQKTAFKAELKTLKDERKAAISKTSTPAERQTERDKLKSELQAWAASNNFPLARIMPKLG